MGQGRDLFGGQADAERQVEFLFAGDRVVHQVLEHALVGGLTSARELVGGCGLNENLLGRPFYVASNRYPFHTAGALITGTRC